MNNYYVYMHVKESDGTPFYIGKGKGYRATSKSGRSRIWNNYANKYGFDVILIEQGLLEEEAFEKEIYWIDRVGMKKSGNGPLVNFERGGRGTSDINKGNCFRGKSIYIDDIKYDSITEASNALEINYNTLAKRIRVTGENKATPQRFGNGIRNPQSKMIIDLETGIFYESISSAAKAKGINRSTLSAQLTGQNKKTIKLKYI